MVGPCRCQAEDNLFLLQSIDAIKAETGKFDNDQIIYLTPNKKPALAGFLLGKLRNQLS